MNKQDAYTLWFDQIHPEDTPYVGGKNANWGEMYSVLTEQGLNVPNNFCLSWLSTFGGLMLAFSFAFSKRNSKKENIFFP